MPRCITVVLHTLDVIESGRHRPGQPFKHKMKERKKRSPIWQISTDILKNLLEECSSFKDILFKLGLGVYGGNNRTLKARLEKEGLSYQKILENYKNRRPIPISHTEDEIFIKNSKITRRVARDHILKKKLIEYQCAICGNKGEWRNQPLHLVLDHINGIPNDHRLENLRWLCPNCNSQTDTFCGRKNKLKSYDNACSVCGVKISPENKSGLCRKCSSKNARENVHKESYIAANIKRRKVNRPSKEELLKLISTTSMIKIGKLFGVTNNAIVKWAKQYGIYEQRKYKKLKN